MVPLSFKCIIKDPIAYKEISKLINNPNWDWVFRSSQPESFGKKNTISFGIVTTGEILEALAEYKTPPVYVVNEDTDSVICGIAIVGTDFDIDLLLDDIEDLYLIDPKDNRLYKFSVRREEHQTTKYFVDTELTVSLEQNSTDVFSAKNNAVLDNYLNDFKIKDTN